MVEKHKQNFISSDFKTARNSYDEYFTIGEEVEHEDKEAGKSIIYAFSIDSDGNEIKCHTSKGWAHIDFIHNIQEE